MCGWIGRNTKGDGQSLDERKLDEQGLEEQEVDGQNLDEQKRDEREIHGQKARERIAVLRKRMKESGVAAYIVPSGDFHGSEYVGDYFKAREYMTGFTG